MNRNVLYLLIGALAVGVGVVSYMLYQERNKGVSINIGEHGVSIDGK